VFDSPRKQGQLLLLTPKPGDYQKEMEIACENAANKCPGEEAESVLFSCEEGTFTTNIFRIKACVTCEDGGEGKSDYCSVRR
jgi:hypothetical protein